MISELLALLTGAFLGSVITASIYRSSQATNVRKAIASVQRYLSAGGDKPLEKLTGKLKLHLDLINEADDLVTRSQWAREQKHRFVSQSVRVVTLRNKGLAKANKTQLVEAQARVKSSGDMLLGYLQFPSWLWLKATLLRLFNGLKRYLASRQTAKNQASKSKQQPTQIKSS